MKIRLAVFAIFGAVGLISACSVYFRAPPKPLPTTSETISVEATFQGKAPEPGTEGLHVCGWTGNPPVFWCLDYFQFQAEIARRNSQGKVDL